MKDYKVYRYPSYYLIKNVYKVPYEIVNELSKWDPVYFKRVEIGYYFDETNHELRIPRGYSEENISAIFKDCAIEDVEVEAYDSVNIQLTNSPRNYVQEHVLAFMIGEDPYGFTRTKTQLYTDLDTGLGKTYIMIATACYFKSRMVVITPAISKVINQWMESISKFTSLNRTEYLNVQGSEMCSDIIKGKYNHVKIFIIPRSTILAFVRKYENRWEMVTKLFDAMHANIKAVDEAHMDFHTVVGIDCYTNIDKTYYMSSSPSRSEKIEKMIYHKVFKSVLRYGKKIITKEQKHMVPLIIQFKSTPTEKQLKEIKTRYGPSLAKYGEYLLNPEGARDEFLDAFIFSLYWLLRLRRRGGKILVICITVEFAKELQTYTKSVFPYLSSGLFVGSGKEKNKELNNDIIFSTTKSMGTGSEIENHQHTINTITYSSEVMADQISGRIRAQQGRKGIYCELVNINHRIAKDHYLNREPYLIRKAKDGKLITYNLSDSDLEEMYKFFKKKYRYDTDGRVISDEGHIVMHRIKNK